MFHFIYLFILHLPLSTTDGELLSVLSTSIQKEISFAGLGPQSKDLKLAELEDSNDVEPLNRHATGSPQAIFVLMRICTRLHNSQLYPQIHNWNICTKFVAVHSGACF